MTEQEAEVLAARLTRIWVPNSPGQFGIRYRPAGFGIVNDKEGFGFKYNALLLEDVHFIYDISTILPTKHRFLVRLLQMDGEEIVGSLSYDGYRGAYLTNSQHRRASFQEFAAQCTPFFRRGLWLSGFDIEASAHEKAEWIQGFSQEELEAWNVKV